MRRGGIYLKVCFMFALAGCTKFEDASVSKRNTFVHFFNSETNYIGLVAENDMDGGFIVSGEIRKNDGEPDALIIKTDERGHRIWESVIEKSVINAIKPTA